MARTPVVQMKGITKTFGHVVANRKVDLEMCIRDRDFDGVTTYSTGTEPNRRVVVSCER